MCPSVSSYGERGARRMEREGLVEWREDSRVEKVWSRG